MTLMLGFGADAAMAKSKRKKKIVQITLAPKKPSAKKKKRPKRSKPVLVQHSRNEDAEIEPLQANQKLSKFGIQKEWSKKKRKKRKKRGIASHSRKTKKQDEKLENETQLRDNDLNELLNNMKSLTETELISEYEGSL